MTDERTRQWGLAWVALVVALALHVADEALTGFLPRYNAVVLSLRDTYGWVPLPTFSFSEWLTGLIIGVVLLLCLSPLVFAGTKLLRPVSYFLGALMALNALGHLGASLYLGALAPGALSSPLLFVAAVALVTTTFRAGRASQVRRSGFD
jgi:hypothetical protein